MKSMMASLLLGICFLLALGGCGNRQSMPEEDTASYPAYRSELEKNGVHDGRERTEDLHDKSRASSLYDDARDASLGRINAERDAKDIQGKTP